MVFLTTGHLSEIFASIGFILDHTHLEFFFGKDHTFSFPCVVVERYTSPSLPNCWISAKKKLVYNNNINNNKQKRNTPNSKGWASKSEIPHVQCSKKNEPFILADLHNIHHKQYMPAWKPNIHSQAQVPVGRLQGLFSSFLMLTPPETLHPNHITLSRQSSLWFHQARKNNF